MSYVERVELVHGGYCYHREWMSIQGGSWKRIGFPAICAIIHHAEKGILIYDTGYNADMDKRRAKGSHKLYSKLLNVHVAPKDTLKSKLESRGISCDSIERLILSHYHPDHIGGARFFKNAEILCSKEGYERVNRGAWTRRKCGFFPELLPDDFPERARYVEDLNEAKSGLPTNSFGQPYDLLGDGSITALKIGGHANSQVCLLLKGTTKSCFLVADVAWSRKAIFQNRPPSRLTRLIQDNWKTLKRNLATLHQLHQQGPNLIFVPSHCEEALAEGEIRL